MNFSMVHHVAEHWALSMAWSRPRYKNVGKSHNKSLFGTQHSAESTKSDCLGIGCISIMLTNQWKFSYKNNRKFINRRQNEMPIWKWNENFKQLNFDKWALMLNAPHSIFHMVITYSEILVLISFHKCN